MSCKNEKFKSAMKIIKTSKLIDITAIENSTYTFQQNRKNN